jgi:ribose-phosphate pyrophosphokinase
MGIVIIGKPDFAGKIANKIPSSCFIEIEERIFPDGEVCPRLLLSEVNILEQSHAIIALQLKQNQPINQYLISLVWTIYNIKQYNPAKISCFMPYHLYSRQDRTSRSGEPLSIKYLASVLESAGINNFITINSHIFGKTEINNYFSTCHAYNLSAISLLSSTLKKYNFSTEEIICISPDEGALIFAKEAAKTINSTNYGAIKKHRDPNTGEITQTIEGIDFEIHTNVALIIDDLVSSGGTMIGAAQILIDKGVKDVIFAYVHAVHSPENFSRLLQVNPSLILATDTIKTDINGLTIVSVIPLIIEWIIENS